MRRVIFFLTCAFFGTTIARAATTDIKINEIGGYPTSTHEWIEILNTGAEPIDLVGWKFWEGNSKHGIQVNQGDSTIEPGEFAAIVQDDVVFRRDHPSFLGSVFDSAWGSLSENGEEIGLVDTGGGFVEKFIYAPFARFSLERIDATANDYSFSNWRENQTGDTVGNINSYSAKTETPDEPENQEEPPIVNDNENSQNQTPSSSPSQPIFDWSNIRLSELYPHPNAGESEWVEIQNIASSSLDLAGGTLCDSRAGNCTIAVTSGTIAGGAFMAFYLPSSYLNNDGDSIFLKDPNGKVIDSLSYGESNAPESGEALAIDTNDVFVITTKPTPGLANIIVKPVASSPKNSSSGVTTRQSAEQITNAAVPPSKLHYQKDISPLRITRVFPRPNGDEDEFIEITNTSKSIVYLAGWRVADTKTAYSLTGVFAPSSTLVIDGNESAISLNNSGKETIRLFLPNGSVGDEVFYRNPPKGAELARTSTDELVVLVQAEEKPTTTTKKETAIKESSEPKTKKAVAGTKITSPKPIASAISLDDVSDLNNNQAVQVVGTVTALPGTFNTRTFIISDSTGSVEVYSSQKRFPLLALGDTVRVRGSVGAPSLFDRVKIKKPTDVVVIASSSLSIESITIGSAAENIGSLARVRGQVGGSEKKLLYVDDDGGEVTVRLVGAVKTAAIPVVGQYVRVTGLVVRGENAIEIWPRTSEDIVLEPLPKKIVSLRNSPTVAYGATTAGGAAVLLGVQFLKKKLRGVSLTSVFVHSDKK